MKNYLLFTGLLAVSMHVIAQGRLETSAGTTLKTNGNAYIILNNLNLVNNGSFVQGVGDGTTRLIGTVNTTSSGSGITTLDKVEVAVGNGNTHTLQSRVGVSNVLTLSSGQLVSNGYLTIRSNAANTARIAPVTSAINPAVAGNVIVERYIPDDGHRAWRLLGVPATGPQTIFEAWQDTAKNYTGYGTLITSPLHNGTNGFDTYSNNPSMLIHDQTVPSWTTIPLTNTNATRLDSRPGYMLFVRGNRNALPSNTLHDATTLRTTGTLRQGAQSVIVSSSGTGYTLVGNPYASPIDFESIAGTPSLNPNYQLWDANLGGLYGVGGFRLVERTAPGVYELTPSASGSTTAQNNSMRYIHSGQAIFLKASGTNATVTFTESSKADMTPFINPFRTTQADQQLIVNLEAVNADSSVYLADGVRVRYNNSYSAAVDNEDVIKISNLSENLAIRNGATLLIVERRPEVSAGDTILLNLANTTNRNYQFRFVGLNMPTDVAAYLVDKHTSTRLPVDLTGARPIQFNVNGGSSGATDRFMIVFRPTSALPLSFIDVTATQQGSNIAIEWKVRNELRIEHYEVEKSTDGRTFTSANTQHATANNATDVNYKWLDLHPASGKNYYRLKSVGQGGDIQYSLVVVVSLGKGKSSMQVYPTLLTGNIINLRFENQPSGPYQARLLNAVGQVMLSKQLSHPGGSNSITIALPRLIAKGTYMLEVTGPGDIKEVIKIVN